MGRMTRVFAIGIAALMLILGGPPAGFAHADPQACVPGDAARPQAELFATTNTAAKSPDPKALFMLRYNSA
jgi:hypothetical protein